MKKYLNPFKLALAAIVAVALVAATGAHATIVCKSGSATYFNKYSDFEKSGSLLCSFTKDGNKDGDLHTSYDCSSSLKTINFCGGTSANNGTCLIVRDDNGGCYVWNLCNWDGQESIDCNFKDRGFDCKEIEVYGNCPTYTPNSYSVPEPATVVAGGLMLIPLAVQGLRQLRKRGTNA